MKRYVAVIDDDVSVREALPPLLNLLGYDVEVIALAEGAAPGARRNRVPLQTRLATPRCGVCSI
ncbi:FixJ family two-component response regulator [Rhizobium tibeticum]|nr:FixJ family two-component response regulator [Rhizobium tibeticum]